MRWSQWAALLSFPLLVVGGQQCAKVNLEKYEEFSFESLGKNPFRLDPPVDFPQVRRIVFFVDMSHSMVSGPCVQDVDANIGFSASPAHQVYDPNKNVGNPNDHRASGIDCKVDPSLPIQRSSVLNIQPNLQANPPVFFRTHPGMDHEKNRIAIVEKWINNSLAQNPELLIARTKVMIVPVSGGISQRTLNEKWSSLTGEATPFRFYELTDPKLQQVLQWMREEQEFNRRLAESDDVWRYEERTMGTSSPGSQLPPLYEAVQKDMRELNREGLLSFATYQSIHVSDGLVTPIKKNVEDALTLMGGACASCAANPASCSGLCSSLLQRMYDAWGYPEDNELKKMDFYYGLVQALPSYFGSGYLKLDFVQLQKDRLTAAYPGESTFYEKLRPYFDARSARLSIWPAATGEPPFRLAGDLTKSSSYKVTHFFIMNVNARLDKQGTLRVDSDGDGLFDHEEAAAGTSPTRPRSNGYCLDSFRANTAFNDRCEAMAKARSCDPNLDSDGDGLNECEEMLLGTNPFDFDTEGDGLPDSLEWLYGFNPLYSDEGVDSDGDGFLNLTHFASGLGPQQSLKNEKPDHLVRFEMNNQGKETLTHPALGTVLVELFEIIVHHLPVMKGEGVNPANLPPLYASRVGDDEAARLNNLIPYEQQILSVITSPERNTFSALARMVDTTNPERAYWRLYKTEIPMNDVFKQPRLDLSLMKQIRANDRTD